MKIIAFLTTFLLNTLVFAGTTNDVYNIICKELSFSSDVDKCLSIAKSYKYFDIQALDICKDLSFTSDKLNCIQDVGNKTYEAYEIDLCKKKSFSSDKRACLKENGTPIENGQCGNFQYYLDVLRLAKTQIAKGNISLAIENIDSLIYEFRLCSKK